LGARNLFTEKGRRQKFGTLFDLKVQGKKKEGDLVKEVSGEKSERNERGLQGGDRHSRDIGSRKKEEGKSRHWGEEVKNSRTRKIQEEIEKGEEERI